MAAASRDAIDPGDLNKFHTVIVVRGHSRRCLEIMQRAKQHGCRTIYDLDDDLLRLHEAFSDVNNPGVQTFGAARPEIEAMLREADVVKVYGEAAVGSFRSYNERVVAIRPFQIFDRDAPRPLSQRLPLSVGFLGSHFKDDEFGPVLSAIRRIRREGHPLYFEFFGFMPRELQNDAEISHIPWHSSYPVSRQASCPRVESASHRCAICNSIGARPMPNTGNMLRLASPGSTPTHTSIVPRWFSERRG